MGFRLDHSLIIILLFSNVVSAATTSIENLQATTPSSVSVNLTWVDPVDANFDKVMIYLNDTFLANVSKGTQYYLNKTLSVNTLHRFATHSVDTSGNINQTWVNATIEEIYCNNTGITFNNFGSTNITSNSIWSNCNFDDVSGNITIFASRNLTMTNITLIFNNTMVGSDDSYGFWVNGNLTMNWSRINVTNISNSNDWWSLKTGIAGRVQLEYNNFSFLGHASSGNDRKGIMITTPANITTIPMNQSYVKNNTFVWCYICIYLYEAQDIVVDNNSFSYVSNNHSYWYGKAGLNEVAIEIYNSKNLKITNNIIQYAKMALYTNILEELNFSYNTMSEVHEYTLDIWGDTHDFAMIGNRINHSRRAIANNGNNNPNYNGIFESNTISYTTNGTGCGSSSNLFLSSNMTYKNHTCLGTVSGIGAADLSDHFLYENIYIEGLGYQDSPNSGSGSGILAGGQYVTIKNVTAIANTNHGSYDISGVYSNKTSGYDGMNNRIEKANISLFDVGVYLTDSWNLTLTDVNVSNSILYDVVLIYNNNSNINFINMKFNHSKALVYTNNEYENYYYATFKVQDTSGNSINGATIDLTNLNDSTRYSITRNGSNKTSFTTGSSGYTNLPIGNDSNTPILLNSSRNSSGFTRMCYNASVTATGYSTNNSVTNICPDSTWYRDFPNINTYQNITIITLSSIGAANNINFTFSNISISETQIYQSSMATGISVDVNDSDGYIANVSVGITYNGVETLYAMSGGNDTWAYSFKSGVPGTYTVTKFYATDNASGTNSTTSSLQFIVVPSSSAGSGSPGQPATTETIPEPVAIMQEAIRPPLDTLLAGIEHLWSEFNSLPEDMKWAAYVIVFLGVVFYTGSSNRQRRK